jgi:hypothetical protein
VHVNSQQRGLADDLQTAIEAETGKRLDVTVVYEDAEQSDDPGGSSGGGQ